MVRKRYRLDGLPNFQLNPVQRTQKEGFEAKVRDGRYQFESVPCCICGGNNFESLAEKDGYGLPTPVAICIDCGLIQTNPRLSNQSYKDFYNGEYHQLVNGQEGVPLEYFASQYERGREIFEYLQERRLLKQSRPFIVE